MILHVNLPLPFESQVQHGISSSSLFNSVALGALAFAANPRLVTASPCAASVEVIWYSGKGGLFLVSAMSVL